MSYRHPTWHVQEPQQSQAPVSHRHWWPNCGERGRRRAGLAALSCKAESWPAAAQAFIIAPLRGTAPLWSVAPPSTHLSELGLRHYVLPVRKEKRRVFLAFLCATEKAHGERSALKQQKSKGRSMLCALCAVPPAARRHSSSPSQPLHNYFFPAFLSCIMYRLSSLNMQIPLLFAMLRDRDGPHPPLPQATILQRRCCHVGRPFRGPLNGPFREGLKIALQQGAGEARGRSGTGAYRAQNTDPPTRAARTQPAATTNPPAARSAWIRRHSARCS